MFVFFLGNSRTKLPKQWGKKPQREQNQRTALQPATDWRAPGTSSSQTLTMNWLRGRKQMDRYGKSATAQKESIHTCLKSESGAKLL